MRPPKCFEASHTKSVSFLFHLWLNDNWLEVSVALDAVALIGVSNEQVAVFVHVQSVSMELKLSGIR